MTLVWADIYTPDGTTRLGPGPVRLASAEVTHALDGPGSATLRLPGPTQRALDLFQPRRELRIYTDSPGGSARLLGAFIVRDVTRDGDMLRCQGAGVLSLLRDAVTGLGLAFDAAPLSDVIDTLAGLAGFTATVEPAVSSTPISLRFDAASALDAIRTTCQAAGVHFRDDPTTPRRVQVGRFGSDSGYRAETVTGGGGDLAPGLLAIEALQRTSGGGELVNAVLPLGAGDGDAALTLAQSVRGRAVTRPGGDGRTEYWLEDAGSIALYGRAARRLDVKRIAPISNAPADVINAATALDDVAFAWLARHSVPRTAYTARLQGAAGPLSPGDKLTVNYRASLPDAVPERVRGALWIIRASERHSADGAALTVELASTDTPTTDADRVIVGALDAVQVQGVGIKPFPFVNSYVYRRELAPGYPAEVPIDISDAVLAITRCRVRVRTRPFRATVTGAASGGGGSQTSAAGGNHNHRMFIYNASIPSGGFSDKPYIARTSDGGAFNDVKLNTGNTNDVWTESSSGDHTHSVTLPPHTHPPQYGISDDTQYPQGVAVTVDGVDVTGAVGGPLAPSGGATDTVIEISSHFSGALQQLHMLRLAAASGRGEVEATVEVYGVMQSIRV